MQVAKFISDNESQLKKKHRFDAGLDICCSHDFTIPKRSSTVVGTGLQVQVPEGYVGLVWSRSGLSVKHKVEVGAGCIDAGYRGEVLVHLYNHSDKDISFSAGDRIAQLITLPIYYQPYYKAENLDDADRGNKGFGSTGI